MSLFSEKLTYFFEAGGLSATALAQTSGVERTLISKYLSGSRLPSGKDTIQVLAEALTLNPSEIDELLQAYQITKLGDTTYACRQHVKNIIANFYDIRANAGITSPASAADRLPLPQDPQLLTTSTAICSALTSILELEAGREGGKVKLIAQPDFTYLYDCLSSIDFNTHNVTLDNIIHLDNSGTPTATEYNLSCFEKLVSSLFKCNGFTPYYIHERVDTKFNSTTFLPYIVITSLYTLQISYDLDRALLSANANIRTVCEETFAKKMAFAKPIYRKMPTPFDAYMKESIDLLNFKYTHLHNLIHQPCLAPFITPEIFSAGINRSFCTPEMVAHLEAYFKNFNDWKVKFSSTFTEAGLREFIERGRINQIPDIVYAPLPLPAACAMIDYMLAAMERGVYSARIVNPTKLNIPYDLGLHQMSPSHMLIYYGASNKSINYIFDLEEVSLVDAFRDFLQSVQDSDLVYNKEDSEAIIRRVLAEYKAKL